MYPVVYEKWYVLGALFMLWIKLQHVFVQKSFVIVNKAPDVWFKLKETNSNNKQIKHCLQMTQCQKIISILGDLHFYWVSKNYML